MGRRQITDALEPAWKFALGRDPAAGAMSTDGQPTVQKIRLPVETKDAIQNSFDNDITYAKGSAVLHMIEHWVGETKFMGADARLPRRARVGQRRRRRVHCVACAKISARRRPR